MNRAVRTDAALDGLHEERDHIAIQISLLADAETPSPERVAALRRQLDAVEHRISRHRPAEL
jgi:hypothetical protein